jgi:hypothetical protein
MSWIENERKSHIHIVVIMWRRRCIVSPAVTYRHGSCCLRGGRESSLLQCGSQQRRLATTTTTTGDAAVAAAPERRRLLPLVISRRAVQEQQQKLARELKNKASLSKQAKPPRPAVEDLPWPRNIVRAAYAFAALAVPYTLAWLVSTNATLRQWIIPARILNEAAATAAPSPPSPPETKKSATSTAIVSTWSVRLVNALRHHFGVTDWDSLSEPEAVDIQYGCSSILIANNNPHPAHTSLPHRFVDEPTAHIRRQQAWLLQDWLCDDNMIAVRFHAPLWRPDTDDDVAHENNGETSSSVQCTLPATTLARHDILKAAVKSSLQGHPSQQLPSFMNLPLVAIDFPETKKDEEAVVVVMDDGSTSIHSESQISGTGHGASMSLSIYSPWHYHTPPLPSSSSSAAATARKAHQSSRAQVEAECHVARLDHEIAQLHAELKSGATYKPIDDLQEELRRKQKERFQWQCKKWMGISW